MPHCLKRKKMKWIFFTRTCFINVTAFFFRDTETHQYLKTSCCRNCWKTKNPMRGCAFGWLRVLVVKKPYSIAITLLEIQAIKFHHIPVQIFATDLDANAITKARIGDYSKTELEESVTKTSSTVLYQITKRLSCGKAKCVICVCLHTITF